MMGKNKKHEVERILDVDASMQGTLSFKDPVNLKINGKFEGILNTKGNLMIGEHASVNADVTGESIIIAGNVRGNISALKELKLIAPACVVGEIKTPLLLFEKPSYPRYGGLARDVISSGIVENIDQSHGRVTPDSRSQPRCIG